MFYEDFIAQNKEWIDSTFEKIKKKLSKTAVKSRNKLPYTANADGVHDDHTANVQLWANGFWGGLMWMMYKATGNEDHKLTARRSEELLDPAFESIDQLNHDVGFMWPSHRRCGLSSDRRQGRPQQSTAQRYDINLTL